MATRRSRKQVHDFTHPKVTGDIPVFIVKEAEGITFEVDLTLAKLTPRIPFCKSGDGIPALVAEAQSFIDTYLTLAWAKYVYFAATPILNDGSTGLEVATGIIEQATWPAAIAGGEPTELWRSAETPWETRSTPFPADFKHSNVQFLLWTPEIEAAATQLKAKVASFGQSVIAGLASTDTALQMLGGRAAKA